MSYFEWMPRCTGAEHWLGQVDCYTVHRDCVRFEDIVQWGHWKESRRLEVEDGMYTDTLDWQ